jgi:hypothetical protein
MPAIPMRPKQPDPKEPDGLFRARLSQQLDMRHPLVRLAGVIDWAGFEDRFGELYHPHVGRPGVPIRLMVGLCYLQHAFHRALGREPVLAVLLRLRLPAAGIADRPELAGSLAAADRSGRHRAPVARDHRRGPAG